MKSTYTLRKEVEALQANLTEAKQIAREYKQSTDTAKAEIAALKKQLNFLEQHHRALGRANEMLSQAVSNAGVACQEMTGSMLHLGVVK